jgi:hypothetical protein
MLAKLLACRCQPDLLSRPVEQLDRQLVLELLDGGRQRRLHDVHPLGGPGEAHVLGDRDEVLQLAQSIRTKLSVTRCRLRGSIACGDQPGGQSRPASRILSARPTGLLNISSWLPGWHHRVLGRDQDASWNVECVKALEVQGFQQLSERF